MGPSREKRGSTLVTLLGARGPQEEAESALSAVEAGRPSEPRSSGSANSHLQAHMDSGQCIVAPKTGQDSFSTSGNSI